MLKLLGLKLLHHQQICLATKLQMGTHACEPVNDEEKAVLQTWLPAPYNTISNSLHLSCFSIFAP
jgi:hypothetical protein